MKEMTFAIANILKSYTDGFYDMDQANKALEAAGASFRISVGNNSLTQEDKDTAVLGDDPAEITGWGLVESSDGRLQRVHCQNGVLKGYNPPSDTTAYFIIGSRIFLVGPVGNLAKVA